MQGTQIQSLGQEDPLEEELATHSSILAGKMPWTEVPGGLQSMGSQRVGHDRVTNTRLHKVFSRKRSSKIYFYLFFFWPKEELSQWLWWLLVLNSAYQKLCTIIFKSYLTSVGQESLKEGNFFIGKRKKHFIVKVALYLAILKTSWPQFLYLSNGNNSATTSH